MADRSRAKGRQAVNDGPPLYAMPFALINSFLREYEIEVEVFPSVNARSNRLETENGAFGEETNDSQTAELDDLKSSFVKVKKYARLVERVARQDSRVIDVWLDDLEAWKEFRIANQKGIPPEELQVLLELADKIETNTLRYVKIMEEILDEMVQEEKEKEANRKRLNGQTQASAIPDLDSQISSFGSSQLQIGTSNSAPSAVGAGQSSLQHQPPHNIHAESSLLNPSGGAHDPKDAEGKPSKGKAVQALLKRRYELHVIPREKRDKDGELILDVLALRNVRASHVGKLVKVSGIVTRVTEVKPMLLVATYTCDTCGNVAYQQVNDKTFMPLKICDSGVCKVAQRPGKLKFHTRGSRFIKFQQIKLQELSSQVPIGHIPRTLGIHVTGEMTRKTLPGDVVTVAAIFLPVANQGFQAMRYGLVAETYLMAQRIDHHKKRYVNEKERQEGEVGEAVGAGAGDSNSHSLSFDPSLLPPLPPPGSSSSSFSSSSSSIASISSDMSNKIQDFLLNNSGESRYSKLAKSIAPEIFGHEDVKKALLLQMVGGVTRVMEDGMRIRGDVNICLMGDPGVAKSQLLKSIVTIAPRAVYTSGKGSTGVGLTAAILRDPHTKEFVLEGGSLTIADMGICCIDEFDKMDESDRTAIHEVMEQQTISIAKAGITTTLNARTAVLAAANPAWGRYNPRRSPTENINLPASLLSRFDLMFLLLDRADSAKDRQLAMHITHVHRNGAHPPLGFEPLEPNMMRAYISLAKTFNPYVPDDLIEYITSAYCNMRDDAQMTMGGGSIGSRHGPGAANSASSFGGGSGGGGMGGGGASYASSTSGFSRPSYSSSSSTNSDFGYTTARSLLAILRLSQALARLRFSNSISKGDIDEAIRLMNKSKMTLLEDKNASSSHGGNSTSGFKRKDDVSSVYNIIRQHAQLNKLTEIPADEIGATVVLKGYSQKLFDEVLDTYEKLGIWTLSANRRIIKLVTL